MTEDTYFFDSYALVEIFKGNENYMKYSKCNIVMDYLNLFEIYYNLIKHYDKNIVNVFFGRLKGFCIDLKFEWIKEASELRISLKKDLSYADCLGYVISRNLKIKFLTGDKEFKGLDNVEFIK